MTILNSSAEEYIIQKSRFIGYAMPCDTEEEALSFIESKRKEHAQATHNCYAYVIGANAGIMRYSDDGEPQGTAGLPMMGVLQAKNLVNLCVVVTRYFGGILLGAGGLVRAYSKGCTLAVDSAKIITMQLCRRMVFDVPYPNWDRLKYFFNQDDRIVLENEEYAAQVTAGILVKEEDAEAVLEAVQSLINDTPDYILSDPFVHYLPSP
ncbi:MAG: YigZ family protein [Christensenellaceae bacterium]|nr:YigZ family protein [Christensenellaceae bacterium]